MIANSLVKASRRHLLALTLLNVFVLLCGLSSPLRTAQAAPAKQQTSGHPSASGTKVATIPAARINFIRRVHSAAFLRSTASGSPSFDEVSSEIERLAAIYDVPAIVIKALVFEESGWRQFDEDGKPLTGPDGSVGLMQINGSIIHTLEFSRASGSASSGLLGQEIDSEKTQTDWRYNLEVGVQALVSKRNQAVASNASVTWFGAWYYPLASFDGFEIGGQNDPSNPIYTRTPITNVDWLDVSIFPFQECVWNIVDQRFRLPRLLRRYFASTQDASEAIRPLGSAAVSGSRRDSRLTSSGGSGAASGSTVGWASVTHFRSADTDILQSIVSAGMSFVGPSGVAPSPQSIIVDPPLWGVDTDGGDGKRMRNALSRYDNWYRTTPQPADSANIALQMIGDFDSKDYLPGQKAQLVDRIISVYDAAARAGSVTVPVTDGDTLSFLGIRAQCVEFAKRLVSSVGGEPSWTYASKGLTDPSEFRPGMILTIVQRSSKGVITLMHTAIIVDIHWDTSGMPDQIKVVESNFSNKAAGSWPQNPSGEVPWLRVVDLRSTPWPIAGANVISVPPSGGPPPDFSISVAPITPTVTQGGSAVYRVTVQSQNGFDSPVTLSALNLPGIVLPGTGFTPATITPLSNLSATATFTLVTNTQTPPGADTITFRGLSGAIAHQATAVVTINQAAGPTPDFSVSVTPATQTVTQGGAVVYNVTVQSQNAFNSPVSLSALNLPGNLVPPGTGFNPATVTPPPNSSASSLFTLVTNTQTPPGTDTITFKGQSGPTTHQTTANVTVAQVRSTPQISSINPPTPVAGSANQNVIVFGSQFQSGLTVSVTFPNGGSATLSGSQIQNLTSTSFTMVITLNGAGSWAIRVNNPDGGESNTFLFNVLPGKSSPTISSILPSSPFATPGNQNVSVFGSQFQAGLTVSVFFPGGGSSTLSGSQIQSVSGTSFVMVINFNGNRGQYSLRINNPDGGQSPLFTFQTQ